MQIPELKRIRNLACTVLMEDLPPGFRFYPTEEELVLFYLHNKLQGSKQDLDRVIPVIDLYGHDPWQLPQRSGDLCHGDPEQWFFFTPRQEREARGGRPTRSTSSGYWKGAGSPGYVYSSSNKVIGIKRTMVFYMGKVPTGRKTTWKMNEYRAIEGATSSNGATAKLRCEFSLCRVYRGSGFLRAFDRRPSAGVRSETPAQQADTNVAGTSHQNPFPIVKGSSSSSSSSSGNHNAPQINADIDWDDLISLVELGNSAIETERKNC